MWFVVLSRERGRHAQGWCAMVACGFGARARAMAEAPRLDERAPAGAVKRRYALLINPFYAKDAHGSFGKHVLTPTLALTSVAAGTPQGEEGWDVRIWDENLLQGSPPVDPMPEVVGVTVHLTFAHRAYELARWYRARGAKVVLGGLHVQSCPDEAAQHADAIALGDGAVLWGQILRDVDAGTLQPRYACGFGRPYRENPPPRRDLLPRSSYLTTTSVIATRGCHNRCGFCYLATRGLQMPYQMLDVEQVVQQIRQDGQPYAVFTDNNLGSNRDYLHRLCEALRPTKIIWSAAVSLDTTDDPQLVREMALAGCTGVFVGFETLNGANLAAAGKRSPRPDDYARRVGIFHDSGIQVNGSFVFGFDEDGPDVFARTVEWIEQARLACATFHILTPYPGTPLFAQYEREGRLLHSDWRLYDTSHVVFRPKRMTVEQLEEGYAWTYRRMFSAASIWRRRPATLSGLPAYLAAALLYKKCNWLWPWLIRYRLTGPVWRPLIQLARWRHLAWREREVSRLGLEPRTLALKVPCSTN